MKKIQSNIHFLYKSQWLIIKCNLNFKSFAELANELSD